MTERKPQAVPGAASPGARDPEALRRRFDELAGGRAEALEGIYRAYSDELYGLALWRTGSNTDAADIVQEVFLRLARARDRLAGVRDPLSYLRRIAHRAAIDLHRQRSRRPEHPLTECALVEAAEPMHEQRIDAGRASGLLHRLTPQHREAIYLRHYAGCSFAEIGRATGVPTFTAASRYRLGINRLRRLLGVKS